MNTPLSFPVVIPAAGIGSRMQASKAKQYLMLGNKTILEHTIDVFIKHDQISDIVVVLHPQDQHFENLSTIHSLRNANQNIMTITGGEERVDSVLAGLQYLQKQGQHAHALVHDAARPCLSQNDLSKLITQTTHMLNDKLADGAILAVPVADTIKQAEAPSVSQDKHSINTNNCIHATVDRSLLYHAQTPQMFPINILIESTQRCLEKGLNITDEASAMEHCGYIVGLVEGQSSNIKITRPSDLGLAEYYLSTRA